MTAILIPAAPPANTCSVALFPNCFSADLEAFRNKLNAKADLSGEDLTEKVLIDMQMPFLQSPQGFHGSAADKRLAHYSLAYHFPPPEKSLLPPQSASFPYDCHLKLSNKHIICMKN